MFFTFVLAVYLCFSSCNAYGFNQQDKNVLPTECGVTAGSDRIIGGNETSLDAYPWLVLIEYKIKKTDSILPLCGGSLITSKYVVTAAHCVIMDYKLFSPPLNVRLGEHDLRTDPDCRPVDDEGNMDCNNLLVTIQIELYLHHPEFSMSATSRRHDIALIKMASAVDFTDFIKPICLPANKNVKTSDGVFAAGWGKTEKSYRSEVKLDIKINLIDRPLCQKSYLKYKIQLFEGQLCAGSELAKDTCSGDSGGPLMTYSNSAKSWQLIGVISFGPLKCGTPGFSAIYTNVSHYMDWITSNLIE